MKKLVPLTRAEPGCISYELHQDNDIPAHFIFVECWESRALWQAHKNAPHLVSYMKATEGAVVEFILNEMTVIS